MDRTPETSETVKGLVDGGQVIYQNQVKLYLVSQKREQAVQQERAYPDLPRHGPAGQHLFDHRIRHRLKSINMQAIFVLAQGMGTPRPLGPEPELHI
jgi:hypothetical protein